VNGFWILDSGFLIETNGLACARAVEVCGTDFDSGVFVSAHEILATRGAGAINPKSRIQNPK
jgi:hypothetical protein